MRERKALRARLDAGGGEARAEHRASLITLGALELAGDEREQCALAASVGALPERAHRGERGFRGADQVARRIRPGPQRAREDCRDRRAHGQRPCQVELSGRVALPVGRPQIAGVGGGGGAQEQRHAFGLVWMRPHDCTELTASRFARHRAGIQRGGNARSRRAARQGVSIRFRHVAQPGGRTGRVEDERSRRQRLGAGGDEERARAVERRVRAEEPAAPSRLRGKRAGRRPAEGAVGSGPAHHPAGIDRCAHQHPPRRSPHGGKVGAGQFHFERRQLARKPVQSRHLCPSGHGGGTAGGQGNPGEEERASHHPQVVHDLRRRALLLGIGCREMRLSIATKVFLGFAAVLVMSGAVSLFGIVQMHRIGQGLSLVSSGYFPLTRIAGSLEAFQKERERSTDRLLAEADPAQRASLIALDRTYFARIADERLARAREQIQAAREGASARDRAALERIDARLQLLSARIAEEDQAASTLAQLLAREGRVAAQDLPGAQDPIARLKTSERRVDHEIRTLLNVIQEQMNGGLSEAERQERTARWAIIGLSLLALGVGLLVTWRSNRALAPIARLTEAAQRLGRGAPDAVAVAEGGGGELPVLAREFNAMAQRLAARERELRAQGEALVRSERLAAIGRIAARITHEIRNPLSSISLNAEELGERAPEARELCDAIVREVDRLTSITEEYLRFARLPKPQLSRADLNEVVRDLLTFVRPELDANGVEVALSLSPSLPRVPADVAQVRQLLLNLLRNAREAMPAGGSLRVTTRVTRGAVEIEVRDTGPGIPPDRLARIFDPFFTTKERGTGLGLAVAQEIAQEHGGQLFCDSAPGRGTAFTLRLPVPALPEPAAAPAIASA